MEISVKHIIIIVLLQLIAVFVSIYVIYRMNDVPWDDSMSAK